MKLLAVKFKGSAKFKGSGDLTARLTKKERKKILKSIEKTIRKKVSSKKGKLSKKELKKLKKLVNRRTAKSRLKRIVKRTLQSELKSLRSLMNRQYDWVRERIRGVSSELGQVAENVERILERLDDAPPDDLERWREILRENMGETVVIRTTAGTISGEVSEVGEDYAVLIETDQTILIIPLYNIETITTA